MKTVNKKDLLEQLEKRVSKHLSLAKARLRNLDAELLNQPSSTGGWSVAQCLEHLNIYGDYYIPAMEKQINDFAGQPDELFKSTWLGSYFTRMMEPKERGMKMMAMKGYSPPAALDPHAVVARFIHQQEQILGLLALAQKADLNAIRIPVSIARFIKLKLGDVFGFITAHNERHIQQALKVLS